MRIGIDVSASVYGTGVSDYVINLVNNLPGEELVLWGGSLRRQTDLKDIFPKVITSPLSPNMAHLLWNKLHIYNVEHLVGKIDVWHASDWTQPPTRAKKVTTVHDLAPFLYPTEMDPQIVAVHTARMRWVAQECDLIICVSQNTAQDLQRLFGIAPTRTRVIYEALPARFMLKPQLTKDTNYVFALGARQGRKNIANLQKACSLAGVKLITAGEGSDLGYITDQQLVDYLAGASAFIYPSLYEGFGLPVLGAFYHGVPVACSNTSSLPEVAGDAAVYFNPLDVEDMAKAITQAIGNRQKLVTSGRKQLTKFSWQKTAQDTYQVYRSLC